MPANWGNFQAELREYLKFIIIFTMFGLLLLNILLIHKICSVLLFFHQAASVEFAKKSGLQPLQHLLLPRTKGFLLTVKKNRNWFLELLCNRFLFNLRHNQLMVLKRGLLPGGIFERTISCHILRHVGVQLVRLEPYKWCIDCVKLHY